MKASSPAGVRFGLQSALSSSSTRETELVPVVAPTEIGRRAGEIGAPTVGELRRDHAGRTRVLSIVYVADCSMRAERVAERQRHRDARDAGRAAREIACCRVEREAEAAVVNRRCRPATCSIVGATQGSLRPRAIDFARSHVMSVFGALPSGSVVTGAGVGAAAVGRAPSSPDGRVAASSAPSSAAVAAATLGAPCSATLLVGVTFVDGAFALLQPTASRTRREWP